MDKIIKCLLLDVDNVIISEVEEVGADIGEPDCKLIEPFVYDYENGTLYPWLLDLTTQNTFMISSDKILTLAEPSSKIVKKYEKLV